MHACGIACMYVKYMVDDTLGGGRIEIDRREVDET